MEPPSLIAVPTSIYLLASGIHWADLCGRRQRWWRQGAGCSLNPACLPLPRRSCALQQQLQDETPRRQEAELQSWSRSWRLASPGMAWPRHPAPLGWAKPPGSPMNSPRSRGLASGGWGTVPGREGPVVSEQSCKRSLPPGGAEVSGSRDGPGGGASKSLGRSILGAMTRGGTLEEVSRDRTGGGRPVKMRWAKFGKVAVGSRLRGTGRSSGYLEEAVSEQLDAGLGGRLREGWDILTRGFFSGRVSGEREDTNTWTGTGRIRGLGGSGAPGQGGQGVSKLSAKPVPYLCPYRREASLGPPGGIRRREPCRRPYGCSGSGWQARRFLGQWERAQRAGADRAGPAGAAAEVFQLCTM